MRLGDRQALGDLPLQDHRPESETDVYLRSAVYACRVEARDEFGRYIAQGHQKQNKSAGSASTVRTIGDLIGGHFYEADPDKRKIPAWSFAMPAKLTSASPAEEQAHSVAAFDDPTRTRTRSSVGTAPGQSGADRVGELLPIFNEDWAPDERFKPIASSILPGAPSLPAGTVGVVLAGTNERAQESLFLPSFSPLVAVNKAGDPSLSSYVYDLTADDELDPEYRAQLHTMVRVCRVVVGEEKVGALAWQLGLGGQDGARGRGLVYDEGSGVSLLPDYVGGPRSSRRAPRTGAPPSGVTRERGRATATQARKAGYYGERDTSQYYAGAGGVVLAYASARVSGPFEVGEENDVHRIGTTANGDPINALHIATDAYFKGGVGDGPLEFKTEPYNLNTVSSPFLAKVHLRWDMGTRAASVSHKFLDDRRPGKWRWQAEVPTYVAEEEIIPDPEDDPPPLPKRPKKPKKPKGRPKEDGESGDPWDEEEDGVPPEGAAGDPATGRPVVGWGVGGWGVQVGDPYWPSVPRVGDSDENRRETLFGVVSQTPTFAAACRAAGGLHLRPFATAEGEPDLARGGRPTSRMLSAQQEAPDTAAIVAVGRNSTGQWFGFEDDGHAGRGKARTGPGGLAVLPPAYATADGLGGVLAGFYEPSSSAHPWTEATRAAEVYLPGGLASLEFSHPRPDGPRSGVSMRQTSRGLLIAPYDGAGSLLASPSLEVGSEIGVKATGDLEITGKLTVGGLIDPTGLDLVKQSATPISGSRYGLWTSDGTVAGTSDGGLYWDSAGARVALAPENAGSVVGSGQTITVTAPRLVTDGQAWRIFASGENDDAGAQVAKLEINLGASWSTLISVSVPAGEVWKVEGMLYRVSSSAWIFSGEIAYHGAGAATLAKVSGGGDLGAGDTQFRVDAGSASGTCDALLIDRREV